MSCHGEIGNSWKHAPYRTQGERGRRRRGGEGVIEGFLILLLQSVSSSLDIVFVHVPITAEFSVPIFY